MANTSSPANSAQKYVGVPIFDFSKNSLTALRWAHEFGVNLPKGYELRVIRIQQVQGQPPCDKTDGSLDSIEKIESALINEARGKWIEEFQELAASFSKNICLKIFQGDNIQQTLQHAIDNLPGRLDTLIVGCAGAGGSQTIPPVELQLPAGCSVVLAKIDDGGGAKKYTLSLSPTPSPTV